MVATYHVPKMAGQILDVPVFETVEQLVKLPNTVSQDGHPAADCGADC